MYSKIVNPKTGRKVSITGRIGKTILRNYFNVLNGGSARDATLNPDYLTGLSNITISVKSARNEVKGDFMIDSKSSLADLVNRIIDILNTTDGHWNSDNIILIANGERIWPSGTNPSQPLQEIGIFTDITIVYMERLESLAKALGAQEFKDAEEAEVVARQRALDEEELDMLEGQTGREWSPSFDSEDDEVNEFARHFRDPREVVDYGVASKAVSDSDTSLEALIASFEEEHGEGVIGDSGTNSVEGVIIGDSGTNSVESESEDSIPSLEDLIAQFEAETGDSAVSTDDDAPDEEELIVRFEADSGDTEDSEYDI